MALQFVRAFVRALFSCKTFIKQITDCEFLRSHDILDASDHAKIVKGPLITMSCCKIACISTLSKQQIMSNMQYVCVSWSLEKHVLSQEKSDPIYVIIFYFFKDNNIL